MVMDILRYWRCFGFCCLFTIVVNTQAATYDASKINSLGVWAAGSSIPSWLSTANALGSFAGKWGSVITIGATIAGALLQDYQTPPNQLTLLPKKNTTPQSLPGWSNPDSPPSTSSVTILYTASCQGAVSSVFPDTTCQSCNYPAGTSYDHSTTNTCYYRNNTTGGVGPYTSVQTSNTCPAGYILNTGTCTLSQPAQVQWPSDGSPSYYPDPDTGTIKESPRDPDNQNGNWSSWPGKDQQTYSRSGTDPVGNPTSETVTVTGGSNPTTTIEQSQQGVAPDGGPGVQKQTITYNSNGIVTSVTNQFFYNSTLSNIAPVSSQPTNNPNMDTSDLAKENTLHQTNNKLDSINNKLAVDTQTAYPTIPGAKTFQETTEDFITTLKSGSFAQITNWNLSSSETCPTWSAFIPYIDYEAEITQFCDMEPYIKPPIQIVMTFVWLYIAFRYIIMA